MPSNKISFENKKPEEEELEKKLSELQRLEQDLTQKELDLATFQAELNAFELRYLRIVGSKMAELDNLRAQIAEAFYQLHPADRTSKKEAGRAREQADESARVYGEAELQPRECENFKPSESLKSLYKKAAKLVHPDLASDEKDRARRTKIMAEINDAYKKGNEAHIHQLLQDWEISPDQVLGDDIGARLIRTIRKITQIRKRLADLRTETEIIDKSDVYKLMMRVKQAEDIGRDLFTEMVAQLNKEIAVQKIRLDQLLSLLKNSRNRA